MSDQLARLDELLAAAEALPDPHARQLARRLAAAVIDLAGDALARACELGGNDVTRRLADDPYVGAVLVLCDRHPDPLAVRATAAVAGVAARARRGGRRRDSCRHRCVGARDRPARARPSLHGTHDAGRARGIVEAAITARAPDADGATSSTSTASRSRATVSSRSRGSPRRALHGARCDLCAEPLPARRAHLFEPRTRSLTCACRAARWACPGPGSRARTGACRSTRTRVAIDPTRWLARLNVPVGVAAVLVHDDGRAVVTFPGPAGLVETDIDAELWMALRAELPELGTLAPEVEAIACSTLPGGGAWRVGIDVVFEMVGELRASWHGMTGGPAALSAVARVLAGPGAGAS